MSDLVIRKKFIHFSERRNPGKVTKRWDIINNKSLDILGWISWYGAWRQYCVTPAGDHIIFNSGCLKDIASFLDEQNKAHKEGLKK